MNINETFTLDDGTLVVFLGYQDDKRFGFFREVSNLDTFFGWKIARVMPA